MPLAHASRDAHVHRATLSRHVLERLSIINNKIWDRPAEFSLRNPCRIRGNVSPWKPLRQIWLTCDNVWNSRISVIGYVLDGDSDMIPLESKSFQKARSTREMNIYFYAKLSGNVKVRELIIICWTNIYN